MSNPTTIEPFALQALQALRKFAEQGAVPSQTIGLAQLRASQINGCSVYVDQHSRSLKEAGETDERLFAVVAWRETPYFTDAERAALVLTEAVTRLADRADPVPDEVYDEAARHYDEQGLAVLILMIATANLFNRLHVTTRQPELGAPDPRCAGAGGRTPPKKNEMNEKDVNETRERRHVCTENKVCY